MGSGAQQGVPVGVSVGVSLQHHPSSVPLLKALPGLPHPRAAPHTSTHRRGGPRAAVCAHRHTETDTQHTDTQLDRVISICTHIQGHTCPYTSLATHAHRSGCLWTYVNTNPGAATRAARLYRPGQLCVELNTHRHTPLVPPHSHTQLETLTQSPSDTYTHTLVQVFIWVDTVII